MLGFLFAAVPCLRISSCWLTSEALGRILLLQSDLCSSHSSSSHSSSSRSCYSNRQVLQFHQLAFRRSRILRRKIPSPILIRPLSMHSHLRVREYTVYCYTYMYRVCTRCAFSLYLYIAQTKYRIATVRSLTITLETFGDGSISSSISFREQELPFLSPLES